MTTEVLWGNDHLNQEAPQEETNGKFEAKILPTKTVGEQQNEAILRMAQLLQDAEAKIVELKQRVADLEDMLSSK